MNARILHPQLALAWSLAIAGCSQALPLQSGPIMHHLQGTGAGKIKHIVYIVQENRSFDNLFQGYPGRRHRLERQEVEGQDDRAAAGRACGRIRHRPLGEPRCSRRATGPGKLPGTQCRMDGFDRGVVRRSGGLKHPQYVYVPHKDSKPYFDMAHERVVADRMFQSHLDESFVGHQYIIAAQAASSVNLPIRIVGLRAAARTTDHDDDATANVRQARS